MSLVATYRRIRRRTHELFQIPRPDAYYDRPIDLRNPIVFYEGHLTAFGINTLLKRALNRPGLDEQLEVLFARGIDPEEVSPSHPAWPAPDEVRAYCRAAEELIESVLDEVPVEAAHTLIEHELMHQETLLYMLHNLPYEKKNRAGSHRPAIRPGRISHETISIPAGHATLGANGIQFGWDNEFAQHRVQVPAFAIDRYNVTNEQYRDFVEATGGPPPHFWVERDGEWFWRGMFDLIPLQPDWPVYVTLEQANAYAAWRGKRLPTEAEYHRAAFGSPSGGETIHPWGNEPPDESKGHFDFAGWDPVPAGSHEAGASAWGVHDLAGNGWEWTSSLFAPFEGFQPMWTYPDYSVDFFDNRHFVLKGASPVTGRELIRASFRNWFRPNYPYVWAKFRCVV